MPTPAKLVGQSSNHLTSLIAPCNKCWTKSWRKHRSEQRMYAQGDVLLVPVKAVKPPMTGVKLATPDDPVILAKGETTGHRHAFYNRVAMFRDDALARAAHVPETLYIGHVVVAPGGDVLEHGAAQGLAGDH